MPFNRLSTFALGAIFIAVSVGTFSYVNASADTSINACANKSTGALRLLTKGSCKKTERKISWNQQGPQGIPGPQGATAAASNGHQATSVFDVSGTNIGRLVSVGGGSAWDDHYIAIGKYYYRLGSDGGAYDEVLYTGDNCTGTPFLDSSSWPRPLAQSELTVTYEVGTTRVRFFEYASNAVVNLSARSRLADNSANVEGFIVDGRGDCVTFTPWTARASRVLREISPPVVIDTSGPLSLNTP